MNLGQVLRVLARRWLLILGMILAGIVISGLLVFKIGPDGISPSSTSYTSKAVVIIDQPKLSGAAATAAMGRLLVLPQTYQYIVSSHEIAQRASQKLNGVYSAEDIMACTGGETELGTQILKISSCGDNPTDAQAVTSAVVESMKDWLNQRQDDAGVLGANRLALVVISAPQVPTSPGGFPPIIWVFIGAIAGALLGLVAAFGAESVQSSATPEPPAVATLPNGNGSLAHPGATGTDVMPVASAQGARMRRPRRTARSY